MNSMTEAKPPRCNAKQPVSVWPVYCELEDGHSGEHRASTVALGHYVSWPTDAQQFADDLADLVKWRTKVEEVSHDE